MSPRFSPPRSNSGSAYSRHRPNHRVEILWRSLLRMHFLAEGGAALHVTQGKPCCAATTGTKEMLSPNRSDASHLPSAGLERRGREGKGQAKAFAWSFAFWPTFENQPFRKPLTFFGINAWKNRTLEVPPKVTIYVSSFTASANTLVCTSMSASVVSGHISAIL